MLAYPNENRPPFSDVPQALASRHLRELFEQMASEGMAVTGETSDGALIINLNELATRAGSLERARQNLYAALDSLNIARIDLSAGDVIALMGRNPIWWGVARGVESGIPGVANLLREITPDELFERLDQAASFVLNDKTDESDENGQWLAAQLKRAAVADLRANRIFDAGDGTDSDRDFLEPKPEVSRELPEEFRTEVKPYVSPFNESY